MDSEAVDKTIEVECQIAQAAVLGASFVVPAAAGLLSQMGKPVGGPGTMIEGASAWIDASQAMQSANQSLSGLISGLDSDQWSGDARDAFVQKMTEFGQQLNDSYAMSATVSIVLGGLSAPLLAVGPMEDGVAAFMVAEAAFVVSASAATLGVGAAPAEAEANAAAVATVEAAEAFNLALMAIMTGAAAGIEIDSLIDVKLQQDDGSTTIGDDYKQGQIDGAADAAVTAFDWAVDKGVDKAGGKAGDALLGKENPLASEAEKAVAKTAHEQFDYIFGQAAKGTADEVKGAGEDIKDLLTGGGDSGGSGGSDGGGYAGGGGGGGGGGSWGNGSGDGGFQWPDDPPGWPNNPTPTFPGQGGDSSGGDSSGGGGGGGGGGSWGDSGGNDGGWQNPGWPGNNPELPRDSGGGGGGGSWGGSGGGNDGGWQNPGPFGGAGGGGSWGGTVDGGFEHAVGEGVGVGAGEVGGSVGAGVGVGDGVSGGFGVSGDVGQGVGDGVGARVEGGFDHSVDGGFEHERQTDSNEINGR